MVLFTENNSVGMVGNDYAGRRSYMRVAIITSSDSGYRGERVDESGPAIRQIVENAGDVVTKCVLLPDDQDMLSREMKSIADKGEAELLLTTGGTGFSVRDVMPEATKSIIEREVPGIPEAMRMYSMQFTKRAMLSRAACGIRKQTLILNLPGSPKAVRECLTYVYAELHHGVDILTGRDHNCARAYEEGK